LDVPGLGDIVEAVEGFEWDAGNSEKNWKRHQVTQAECEQVFANLPLLVSVTAKAGNVESRYFALGRTDAARELTVVFTVRGKNVRVISARPMSRRERKEYAHAQVEAAPEEADS
jgi:uncharacterized DUF497 family protein